MLSSAGLGEFFPGIFPGSGYDPRQPVGVRRVLVARYDGAMIRTPFYFWMVADERTGKLKRTKYLMTEDDARARHPEAVRIDPPAEWRNLPETDEERHKNWPPMGGVGCSGPDKA